MPIRTTIPDKLKERNMTVKDLANQAGIAYNTALALQRSSSTRIDFDTLDKLCLLFACQPGDLLVFTPE